MSCLYQSRTLMITDNTYIHHTNQTLLSQTLALTKLCNIHASLNYLDGHEQLNTGLQPQNTSQSRLMRVNAIQLTATRLLGRQFIQAENKVSITAPYHLLFVSGTRQFCCVLFYMIIQVPGRLIVHYPISVSFVSTSAELMEQRNHAVLSLPFVIVNVAAVVHFIEDFPISGGIQLSFLGWSTTPDAKYVSHYQTITRVCHRSHRTPDDYLIFTLNNPWWTASNNAPGYHSLMYN